MLLRSRHSAIITIPLILVASLVLACSSEDDEPVEETPASTTATSEATTEGTATEAATATETASETASATSTGAAGDTAAYPIEVTDAEGIVHRFEAQPKILCMWAGCPEILAELGLTPHAAAGTREANEEGAIFNYPPGQLPETYIEDTQNVELIEQAGVDLVVKRVPASPEDDALTQVVPVFYLHHPDYGESAVGGWEAYRENVRLIAAVMGQPEEAAQGVLDRFDAVLEKLKAGAPADAAERTLMVMFNSEGYNIIGPDSPFCDLIQTNDLGQCVGEGTGGELSAEAVLALDPDWIAVQVSAADETWETRSDPTWERLTAVQEGHVYNAGNRYYCCGLRGLTHSLQSYAHYVLEMDVPDPGWNWRDWDITTSPLVAN